MKKIVLLLFLMLGILPLTACSKNGTFALAKNHIAEARMSMYEASTDDVHVTYMCGYREKDYKLDGISTPLIEFGVITFYTKDTNLVNPNFVLTVGNNTYNGKLEQNPFDLSYVADIKVCDINTPCTVKLVHEGGTVELELTNSITEFKIDYLGALEIACKSLDLNELCDSGDFSGECYIKIVNDKTISESYFYYVNILGTNDKSYSVIIDPVDKRVLLKKVKEKSYLLGY